MWKIFGCVLVLLTLGVNRAHSVKCYSCYTHNNYDDCSRPEVNQISLMKCDTAALEQTRKFAQHMDEGYAKLFEVDISETPPVLACLKLVTKVNGKDHYLRGCQLAEQGNLDICKKVRETNTRLTQTVACIKCSTEGCNSSGDFRANAALAILSLCFLEVIYRIF
ncbi:unnamed protein product [Phyllotreta striolata]|uniref:Protein sleepless n=1 Tax=Phyllotreta striolata TaxID=444603 RepID=A0A9N9TXD8_PHYSR|nr:unnamed protein product [Phyllotreta striolata]